MRIPVFYNPAMVPDVKKRLPSPSAEKPKLVVEDWLSRGMDCFVVPCEKASAEWVQRIHPYAKDVISLKVPNGFDTLDKSVVDSCLLNVGSFVRAAEWSFEEKLNSCSPTSGFHHAGYTEYGSFCTFNGLVIAADRLIRAHPKIRIGILDMDHHYGDGTQELIERHDLKDAIEHVSGMWGDAELILGSLVDVIAEMGVDIMFYQAGADQCVDDPCEGIFTVDQLKLRDRIVFETCADLKVPVVWNLAGGYQKDFSKVLDIHRNTMLECIKSQSKG